MNRNSSIALLLDMRRRLRVVVDVLGGMIRGGFEFLLKTCCEFKVVVWVGPVRLLSSTEGFLNLFREWWSCVGMRVFRILW